MLSVRPDARKQLPVLYQEWSDCRRCSLHERRDEIGGCVVQGEGYRRGIMFIGEGPGRVEEREGRPFCGKSGDILRTSIEKLNIDRYYISNIIACRSWAYAIDTEGQPKTFKGQPIIEDRAPPKESIEACLPRLYEEIYLVDPVLIVALGGVAADVLAKRKVRILAESGNPTTIRIPGAGARASLTEKKKAWTRKVRGQVIRPTVQSEVRYLMVPLLHPSFILRKSEDRRWMNPVQVFAEGMLKAATIYDRYMFEVYGDSLPSRALTENDIQEIING